MEDCLTIGFDRSEDGDVATLVVGRMVEDVLHILNTFTGEEAIEMYNHMTSFPSTIKEVVK